MYNAGYRVKYVREHLGMSQKDFADSISIKESALADIEAGKKHPSEKILRRMVLKHQIDARWIIRGYGFMLFPINSKGIERFGAKKPHPELIKIVAENVNVCIAKAKLEMELEAKEVFVMTYYDYFFFYIEDGEKIDISKVDIKTIHQDIRSTLPAVSHHILGTPEPEYQPSLINRIIVSLIERLTNLLFKRRPYV